MRPMTANPNRNDKSVSNSVERFRDKKEIMTSVQSTKGNPIKVLTSDSNYLIPEV